MQQADYGRIDVHSHLLPAIDDGCPSIEESLACARRMVEAGYTHSFCTPHVWPDLPENNLKNITERVDRLQEVFDQNGVQLKLIPGGEIGLRPTTASTTFEEVVSYGMRRRHCLVDFWGNTLPPFFHKAIKHFQALGLKVILAHPERMYAVQVNPGLLDEFKEMGLLLQGNLQCLDDPSGQPSRKIVEQCLTEGRYFMLGSDLHNLAGLDCRLRGLQRAIELVGDEAVWKLTRDNPRQLLPRGM